MSTEAIRKRVPAEHEDEYRDLPVPFRDELRRKTYTHVSQGDSPEATLAKLSEAGYKGALVSWYVNEVHTAKRPIDLYGGALGSWGVSDTTDPEPDRTFLGQLATKYAWMALALQGLFLTVGAIVQTTGFVFLGLPALVLLIGFKVYQVKTAVVMCEIKAEKTGCMTALAIPFGWWPILFLYLKATPLHSQR
jgi:hypothetical protein